MAQQSATIVSEDSTIVVVSKFSKFNEFVEEFSILSPLFNNHWYNVPIPDSIECEGVADLISTCAVFDLPMITNIQHLDDSLSMLFGTSRTGAIRVRHMILLNVFSGDLLGWYAFFTSRGESKIQFVIDIEGRTLIISTQENGMVEDRFYEVDHFKMRFHLFPIDRYSCFGVEIDPLKNESINNPMKGYHVIPW
jgi:hypothetical protein